MDAPSSVRHNAELMFDAAESFVALVSEVPHDAWDRPALGSWDVRALVGHTGRAVSTVLDYLHKTGEVVDCESAATYWAAAYRADSAINDAVAARGVVAGHELGDEPAEVVETMLERLRAAVAATQGDPVITTLFGGIRLSDYLDTRTVEIVIHTSDLATAVGIEPHLPPPAVERVLQIVSEAALANRRGLAAIRQLSGRDGSSFRLV